MSAEVVTVVIIVKKTWKLWEGFGYLMAIIGIEENTCLHRFRGKAEASGWKLHGRRFWCHF